jgi:hypothetical protein
MRVVLYALSLGIVVTLSGCDRSDPRESAVSPAHSVKISPSNHTKPVELVVRLCAPLDSTKIAVITSRHAVSVKNQPSPTLLVFIWKDQRTADVLIKELQADEAICAAEVNQTYHATQPTVKQQKIQ